MVDFYCSVRQKSRCQGFLLSCLHPGELQGKLSSLTEQERTSREQCVSLRSRISVSESKLTAAAQEAAELRDELQELQAHHSQLKTSKDKYVL